MLAPPLLSMRGIRKRFGPTVALDDVSLDVSAGECLALVGENGAGKSTLMKVLSGACRPDAGEMSLAGAPYSPGAPHQARLAGVAMIYQELNLADDLSVADNIVLGREPGRFGVLDRGERNRVARAALGEMGREDLPLDTPVGRLSVAQRQVVEIARALAVRARVVVFDEPTSSLTRTDAERLFQVIAALKRSGLGVVYISHFLEEVRVASDSYVVLRDGRRVAAGVLSEISDDGLVTQMVGRDMSQRAPRVARRLGEPVLTARRLSGRGVPREVSFELRRGEILGIAGLVGAGRTELLRCLFGLDPVDEGSIEIDGRNARGGPNARVAAAVGFVSEDRKQEGLALDRGIADNLTYSRLSPYAFWGWLNLRCRAVAASQWSEKLRLKCRGVDQPVRELSGGNQQKVAIGRVLHQQADILLLDEPTRGVDIATKAEIYRLLEELAAAGKAIVFVSSYLPELLAVCDRVGVMSRGRLREIRAASDWSEEEIMRVATRGDAE